MLFEHGFESTSNEPLVICMPLYFADVFVCKNVVYGYDVVTTL